MDNITPYEVPHKVLRGRTFYIYFDIPPTSVTAFTFSPIETKQKPKYNEKETNEVPKKNPLSEEILLKKLSKITNPPYCIEIEAKNIKHQCGDYSWVFLYEDGSEQEFKLNIFTTTKEKKRDYNICFIKNKEVQKFNREYSLNTERSSIPSKSNINNEHASNYSHQANFIEFAKDNAGTELSQPHNNIEAAFRQNSPEDNTAGAVMESTSLNTENHGIYDQISSPNASVGDLLNGLTWSGFLKKVEDEQKEGYLQSFQPSATNAVDQRPFMAQHLIVSNHIGTPPSCPLSDEGYTNLRKRRGDTTIDGSHNIKKQKIVHDNYYNVNNIVANTHKSSSCGEMEDGSPTLLQSRVYQFSGHETIGNNTYISLQNDSHQAIVMEDKVMNQADALLVADRTMNRIEQEELEEPEIYANIEVNSDENLLYIDDKPILPDNNCQIIVNNQRTIAVIVGAYSGITIYHKYSHQVKIGHIYNASYCCLFQKNQSLWIMVSSKNKFLVYDSFTGVLLKVLETSTKEDVVQWEYNGNSLVYLTQDNQLCVAEYFDKRLEEINVPLCDIKNRKTIKIVSQCSGQNHHYDIPVALPGDEQQIIESVCSMFGYEAFDFEYDKKRSEVRLKNNSFSKLKKLKISKEEQPIDCFLIHDGIIMAHSMQSSELLQIPLIISTTTITYLKQMEVLHLRHSHVGSQMIKDNQGHFIVFRRPNNDPKLFIYRKDQGHTEVDLKGGVRTRCGRLQLTIGFTIEHNLSVEFYYPDMLMNNRFRGEVNLQSPTPFLQNVHTSVLPAGFFSKKNRKVKLIRPSISRK